MRALAACLVACAVHAPPRAVGEVVAAVVLPHGDFVYDPSLVHGANGSKALHQAAVAAGRWLSEEVQPDVVLLSTPHGLELEHDFVLYENLVLTGYAPLGQDLHNASAPGYKVWMNLTTDPDATSGMLRAFGAGVTGLKGFGGGMPLPISWGEIIPMSFLTRRLRQRVVVIGQPLRRYNHSIAMIDDLLALGANVAGYFEGRPERVAVVISSDLAHTHLASGPYGYSPAAEPYDRAAGAWAADLNASALLRTAAGYQAGGAMSCGFTGLVLLQGVVDAVARREGCGARAAWSSRMLANHHPTYYGMMVATFNRMKQ
eukprot:TRINITY_DN20931_c0_g1_i1.p1 TRINITY_DN20931_c0_g1~~TRINITY_DN20931_c0_g1_i1.p1  ORF type:complete len:316 (+),score=83.59 TRINITY_DN20931_c0_g1_i1:61-1008(+)